MSSKSDLEKINKYTRKDLREDEVFIFSLILCDNEIDRDNECFTVSALQKLAQLFIGKTGIHDHNPKAEGQIARIFETEVLTDSEHFTKNNEAYTYLRAKAYIPISDGTADTIKKIDSGILKEVSIGCAVEKILCSVCGQNLREDVCEHGNSGKSHRVLDEPIDAYEWSFVAVPAQLGAGVIKSYSRYDVHKMSVDERSQTNSADVQSVIDECRKIFNRVTSEDKSPLPRLTAVDEIDVMWGALRPLLD